MSISEQNPRQTQLSEYSVDDPLKYISAFRDEDEFVDEMLLSSSDFDSAVGELIDGIKGVTENYRLDIGDYMDRGAEITVYRQDPKEVRAKLDEVEENWLRIASPEGWATYKNRIEEEQERDVEEVFERLDGEVTSKIEQMFNRRFSQLDEAYELLLEETNTEDEELKELAGSHNYFDRLRAFLDNHNELIE